MDEINKETKEKVENFIINPEKATFEALLEFNNALKNLKPLLEKISSDDLEKIQGKDGVTPVRGVDYMTETDIDAMEEFILSKLPEEGVDFTTLAQTKKLIEESIAGIPVIKGDRGIKGDKGDKGDRGNDGSPDTGEQIVDKIQDIKDKNKKLKTSDIRGLDNQIKRITANADDIEQLKKDLKNVRIVMPMNTGGGSGSGGGGGVPGLGDMLSSTYDPAGVSEQLVGISATQILTNKTLNTPTITNPSMDATNPTARVYTPTAGSTVSMNLAGSNQHFITMPAGNVTLTLSNSTNNKIFSVAITQDSVGSRTVTWFAGISWAGGTAPTLTTTALKRDVFGFMRTASNAYDGFVIGQNI